MTHPFSRLCHFGFCSLLPVFLVFHVPSYSADWLAPESQDHFQRLSEKIRSAAAEVSPAVVLITSKHDWDILPKILPPSHPPLTPPPHEDGPFGRGSGTIVRSDGYIISNYHVVRTADSIHVELADRRTYTAAVVGYDSLIDIAVLKIPAVGLPTARFCDSNNLQVGDWVLAIGHPLGMSSTLTHGIVSALKVRAQLGTHQQSQYDIECFIQTNAVINPGNSGGPLLNMNGEVVGINTAISTLTGYYMGYALAVPSTLVQEAVQDILTHGRVVRGYLGVSMRDVTQELIVSKRLPLKRPQGVYLDSVASPAALQGLQPGDIILRVGTVSVNRANHVQSLIYGMDPGETTILHLLRGKEHLELDIILREREDHFRLIRGQKRLSSLGMKLEDLSPERADHLGFSSAIASGLGFAEEERAVVVSAVVPGGPAAANGIGVDDVITEIDQYRLTSAQQCARFVSRLEAGKSAFFWLWRPNQDLDVRALTIPH